MSDDNKPNNSGRDRKPGDVKVPPRNWLIWTLILVAIPMVIFLRTKTDGKYPTITRQKLVEIVESDMPVKGKIYYARRASEIS